MRSLETSRLGSVQAALAALGSRPLLPILALALLLRLVAVPIHSFHHPDEIFQYLEQSHRLAAGYGAVPWEYRVGARNWLIPLLLAWLVWLSDAIGFSGPAYLPAIRVFLALLSLAVVLSFYRIGQSISRTHAIIAGFVGAVWFELVYFSTHALSEPLSLALVAVAAALLKDAERKGQRSLAFAGLLLGIAVLVRYQLAPAAGLLALFTCRLRFRAAWMPVLAGGLAALVLGAALDLAMGMTPFGWLITNFRINVFEGRAAIYGVSGPAYYFGTIALLWQTSTLLLLPLTLIGARRYPALFVAAVAHVLFHSLIGHKEYRFVLLSTSFFVLLSALGSADLLRFLWKDMSSNGRRELLAGGLLFWFLTSLMLASGDRFRFQWTAGYAALAATQRAAQLPNLCGLAVYDMHLYETGGFAYLHRRVPIFPFDLGEGSDALRRSAGAYNAILAPRGSLPQIPSSFAVHDCVPQPGSPPPYNAATAERLMICVYARPGPCSASTRRPGLNEWLIRHDH